MIFNSDTIMQNIRQTLMHGQEVKVPSMTTKLMFPYHWIPGEMRILLSRFVFRAHTQNIPKDHNNRPIAPFDHSVDTLSLQLNQHASDLPTWHWPQNRTCALVLSHDTDTAGQEKGIRELMKIATERGIRSTFSFVGNCIHHYSNLINEMRADGFEVALHDVIHDNRIAHFSVDEIIERLQPAQNAKSQYDMHGFRSPSWYTSPALWEALEQSGFMYDMSALDSWFLFEANKHHGVNTYFPFMVGKLVVLPNTIPFEVPWIIPGLRRSDTHVFWRPKIKSIAQAGGLIMINAHPDRWYCGRRYAADILRKLMDDILETYNPAVMQAIDVARHTHHIHTLEGMHTLPGNPIVCIPRRLLT